MITAVDTSVLLDIWTADPSFKDSSWEALMASDALGGLVICEIVYAEIAARFASQEDLDRCLDDLDITVTAVPRRAAYQAGVTRKHYLDNGGKRKRILADFLVAAHADTVADRLLTRDDGFYRRYFPKLKIIDPADLG